MSSVSVTSDVMSRQAERLAPYRLLLAAFGVLLCCTGVSVPLIFAPFVWGEILLGGGLLLLWISLLIHLKAAQTSRARRQMRQALTHATEQDRASIVITDRKGVVQIQNRAAVARFGALKCHSLAQGLDQFFAVPETMVSALIERSHASGAAYEDVVFRRKLFRFNVHEVGEDMLLWRLDVLEDLSLRDGAFLSLPMLIMDPPDSITFMNEALQALVGRSATRLSDVVCDGPIRSGDLHLLNTSPVQTYARVAQIENCNPDGYLRSELYFLPVEQLSMADWAGFDVLPVALLKVTEDGRITQVNRAARELLSLEPQEVLTLSDVIEGIGRDVTDWLIEAEGDAEDAENLPAFVRARRTRTETFLQMSVRRMMGGTAVHVTDELLVVLTDATELKTLEAQFVQSQKMQAIGQLAGGVAHDFNNLLTAISGHCDLMLLRHDSATADYADLIQIHQNANRAASLVGQLLAFSRKQTLKFEVVDLRDTLSDLTHLLNRLVGEKVSLRLHHDAGLLPIRIDRRQLEQVLLNLVVNARDAMPDGGEIRIETQNEVRRSSQRRDQTVIPAGEYIVLRVCDDGVGIPSDQLQKVFEPFFTTKKTGEGTGLGLSTAYGIIKQSGGFIFVSSTVGVGTEFTIYLPAHIQRGDQSPPAPAPAQPQASRQIASGENRVVLLVEDEAPVRAFASRGLRLSGFKVIEADSGESALNILADPDLKVDVFISDVIMPGMDGPSWVSEALKTRSDVKVIFMSGYAEDDFLSPKQYSVPSIFLPKPFSLADLTRTVQGLFDAV